MTPLDEFKLSYLEQLKNVPSFSNAWSTWNSLVSQKFSGNVTGQGVFDLGDHLSEIFQSTTQSGRSQSTVSGAGAAWECLITWYLNLAFWGTPVVVVRQNKEFVPQCISDCLTVTIANKQTNTESDVLVFSVPDHKTFGGSTIADLNNHIKPKLNQTDLVVLQCKTNWNDNSQIPMLWDMIYNSKSRLSTVSVGINGLSPESVRKFKYGFATVPTVKIEKLKSDGISVLRVKNLTGGNYWGHETKPNIAASIKEFPHRHFASVFSGGVANHITGNLSNNDPDEPDFFKLKFKTP